MDQQEYIIEEAACYKGVVFDLDGTLVDLKVEWGELKAALSKYCKDKKGKRVVFTPLDQKIHEVKDEFGEEFFLELLDIVASFEMKEQNYQLNQKLLDCINSLDNQKIGIYSMNTKKCIDSFVKKYLKKMPDIIISKDSCLKPKPSGENLEKIRQSWRLDKTEMVYIGDSEKDRLSGEMAGLKTYIISFFNK